MTTVNKVKNEETKYFSIEKLDVNGFDFLILQLSSLSLGAIMESKLNLNYNFNGKVIIDTVLHSGNNSSRFISFEVNLGEINYDSRKNEVLERKDEIRIKANDLLRSKPNLVRYSIITSIQKKLLLKGLSI